MMCDIFHTERRVMAIFYSFEVIGIIQNREKIIG